MTTETMRLQWRGDETVASMREALARRVNIELRLPADLHHAVASRLKPGVAPAHGQRLDLSGGAELLARMAGIAALAALARLEDAVYRGSARVRVVSPAPTLYIHFAEARAPR